MCGVSSYHGISGRFIIADGINIECTASQGMNITIRKQDFFFLPEHLTLLDPCCTSESNDTHVWLSTDYDKCSTARKVSAVMDHAHVLGKHA